MFARLKDIEERFRELEGLLGQNNVAGNPQLYQKYAKEHADLRELVETYREYTAVQERIEEGEALLRGNDFELIEIVKEELPELREQLAALEETMKVLLLPKDPNDERNVFLEIRAGTGGDEAGLFVGDLFRMYARYAESQRWKVEIVSSTPSGGVGGFKEIIALVTGAIAIRQVKRKGSQEKLGLAKWGIGISGVGCALFYGLLLLAAIGFAMAFSRF